MSKFRQFHYEKGNPAHERMLGSFKFPVLNTLHPKAWEISMFRMPENEEEYSVFRKALYSPRIFLAYRDDNKIVVVHADFKLRDLGLSLHVPGFSGNLQPMIEADVRDVMSQEGSYGSYELRMRAMNSQHPTAYPKIIVRDETGVHESKLQVYSEDAIDAFVGAQKWVKRAKAIVSPRRLSVTKVGSFNAVILPASKTLDGFVFFSYRLLDEALRGYNTPDWDPVGNAIVTNYMRSNERIYSLRAFGHVVDRETGQVGFLKGNATPVHLPEGVDFVASADNFKTELTGTIWSWLTLEPQGVKVAGMDQQTAVGQPFLDSIPELRSRTRDFNRSYYNKLVAGHLYSNVTNRAKEEYSRDWVWDSDRLTTSLQWNMHAWALYGMSYLDSLFLTRRASDSHVQSLKVDDYTKLAIQIPCAIRAQIISQSVYDLWLSIENEFLVSRGQDPLQRLEAGIGHPRWDKGLKVLVMNDWDWVNIAMPSHGGCDLDDFFVIRWVTIRSERKIVVTRNPNNRGEYSVWDYTEGDWYPVHITHKGKKVSFPPLTKKRWPKQILVALADGDTDYVPLPSQVDPAKTNRDDRDFIAQFGDAVLSTVRANGKPVDANIARRLGRLNRDIPRTTNGPISRAKAVQVETLAEYQEMVQQFIWTLKIPQYLKELGANLFLRDAVRILKSSRYAMYSAEQTLRRAYDLNNIEDEEERREVTKEFTKERVKVQRLAQEEYLMPFINLRQTRRDRARAVLALWLACRTTPTSTTKQYGDRDVFGTNVFAERFSFKTREEMQAAVPPGMVCFGISVSEQDSQGEPYKLTLFHLLDGLHYYGVVGKPYMDDHGRLRQHRPVRWIGDHKFNVICQSCGRGYLRLTRNQLESFWAAEGICANCQ